MKTLQSSSSQEDSVSAINGQFRHPNGVPELAVVVTVGDPQVNKYFVLFV